MIKKIENELNKFVGKSIFPYIFVFVLLLPSIVWIFLDNTVWPWDQAWYGEVSVDLYYKLTNGTFIEWLKAMVTAFGIKAPAIAWFGQFFVSLAGIVGSVDRALLMQIVVAQFLSLFFIYIIVLHLTGKRGIALLGALMMASAPLFVGMGHQYFVESLQLFIVTFLIFIFINIGSWNVYNSMLAIAIASVYAMLVKITSPLYIVLLMLASLFYLIKIIKKYPIKEYFRGKKNIALYIVGLTFLVFSASWYVINWDNIFQFMKLASSGTAAELYGSKDSFFNKFILWSIFFQKSFFLPMIAYIVYAIVGIYFVHSLLSIRKLGVKGVINKLMAFLAISFFSIIIVLVFFSFQINEETRYLLPVLPYIVIIICSILNRMKSNLVVIFFTALFLIQYVFVNGVALDVIRNSSQEISSWVVQKKSDKNNLKIIKTVVERTCLEESRYRINIIGVELPWLNANSVEYYATQDKLKADRQCYYTSLGYAENDPEKAWTRLKSINPPFFIISNEEITKNLEAFNSVSLQISERIIADNYFVRQDDSQMETIKIFKNVSISK